MIYCFFYCHFEIKRVTLSKAENSLHDFSNLSKSKANITYELIAWANLDKPLKGPYHDSGVQVPSQKYTENFCM
jgi:hypothetical protein